MSTAQTKVLLMGPHGGGKTSMRSVIFANYLARDTPKLGATVDVLRSQVRLLGSFTVNMWDCGMQVNYMKEYLTKSRQHTFSNVVALIYVCDATLLHRKFEGDPTVTEVADLREVLLALQEQSPGAKGFILVHKADLLKNRDDLPSVIDSVAKMLREPDPEETEGDAPQAVTLNLDFFPTTIWDDSIFNAWSEILQRLVPNVGLLTKYLSASLSEDIKELTVFESATFLTVCRVSNLASDSPASARVTNALKGFKLSCIKSKRHMSEFVVVTGDITVVFDRFASNTMIMVIFLNTPPAVGRLLVAGIRNGVVPFLAAEGEAGADLNALL